MTNLSRETRLGLGKVSTATITTVLFKRGLRNCFMQGPQRINPGQNMVGEAYTLRYIPSREDTDTIDVFADRAHPQRRGIEECPPGAVFVCDSRGDASAASAGGILIARLQQRGVAGIVTDGGFRDTPDIRKLDMPAYHARPSAPTNLIKHHAVDLNVPIACGGVGVFPADVIVGDGDGVVVIPGDIVEEVMHEALEMTHFERFVEDQVKAGHSIFGLYPQTDPQTQVDFDRWKKTAG